MYRSEAKNDDGFYAKVVASSNCDGTRIDTLELKYPRFIHAEFMTHRMFSRNASSSRAIPVEKFLKQIQEQPATPIHWGANQAGMQAEEELDPLPGQMIWAGTCGYVTESARRMADLGYHKQLVNRLTEPFQFIKVIVTATEWDNFFNLRLHPDAQPEIQELARLMKQAMVEADPTWLEYTDWHLPYIRTNDIKSGATEEQLIKVSAGRCARVSYLNHDNSSPDIQKDIDLANMLQEAGHMSPFEHQAQPMPIQFESPIFEEGMTHMDKWGVMWSGNFRNWIQYRQLL